MCGTDGMSLTYRQILSISILPMCLVLLKPKDSTSNQTGVKLVKLNMCASQSMFFSIVGQSQFNFVHFHLNQVPYPLRTRRQHNHQKSLSSVMLNMFISDCMNLNCPSNFVHFRLTQVFYFFEDPSIAQVMKLISGVYHACQTKYMYFLSSLSKLI